MKTLNQILLAIILLLVASLLALHVYTYVCEINASKQRSDFLKWSLEERYGIELD